MRRKSAISDPLPLDPAGLAADQLVAEIIMQPAKTPLLAAAAAVEIMPGPSRGRPRRSRAHAQEIRHQGELALQHRHVVNATSLGLRPDDPLPLDPAGLAADQLVAEIIMHPRLARACGCAR
jgi:shikimate 5-dehydrogenase